MSLNVYWGGPITPEHKLYAALSDEMKTFLCPPDLMSNMNVPLIMMATGVTIIVPHTLPSLMARMDFSFGEGMSRRLEQEYDLVLPALLKPFIGVTCNWNWDSNTSYIKRLAKHTDIVGPRPKLHDLVPLSHPRAKKELAEWTKNNNLQS